MFNPPAELARVHIRNAVEYVLQYPPAQGKYALENLLSEVDSEYFPNTPEKALIALQKSPLLKARTSLVRNFIIVLLKKFIADIDVYKEQKKYVSALKATEMIHKEIYDDILSKKLSDLLRLLEDNQLDKIVSIIRPFPEIWTYIDDDVKQRIESYVENIPTRDIIWLEFFLGFKPLQLHSQKRFNKITQEELNILCFGWINPRVGDLIIKLFLSPNSHKLYHFTSIKWGEIILKTASDYSFNQVQRIIEGINVNGQIKNSKEVRDIIYAFRHSKTINQGDFEKLLKENNLQ